MFTQRANLFPELRLTYEMKKNCCWFLFPRGQRSDSERHRRQLESMLHRGESQKVGGAVTRADDANDVEDEAIELLGEWCHACVGWLIGYTVSPTIPCSHLAWRQCGIKQIGWYLVADESTWMVTCFVNSMRLPERKYHFLSTKPLDEHWHVWVCAS